MADCWVNQPLPRKTPRTFRPDFGRLPGFWMVLIFLAFLSMGCRRHYPQYNPPEPVSPIQHKLDVDEQWELSRLLLPHEPGSPALQCNSCQDGWDQIPELALEDLLGEVLANHSAVVAAEAGWHASAQLYPQVTAFEDPQFRYLTGTQLDVASNGSLVDYRQRMQLQQRIPFWGKRHLHGEIARNDAKVSGYLVVQTHLNLTEAVKQAYNDYAAATQKLKVLALDEQLLDWRIEQLRRLERQGQFVRRELQESESERSHQRHTVRQFHRQERLARAKLNQLLERPPECPLPPPLPQSPPKGLPSLFHLRDLAIQHHPDLSTERARIASAEHAIDLAYKDYFPDVWLVSRFDVIDRPQGEDLLRSQIGFNVYVPTQISRRNAAVYQTQAQLRQRKALHQELVNRINHDVQMAWEDVSETREQVLELQVRELSSRVGNLEAPLDFPLDLVDQPIAALEWIARRRDWLRERARLIDALAEHHHALAQLEFRVGVPLTEEVFCEPSPVPEPREIPPQVPEESSIFPLVPEASP